MSEAAGDGFVRHLIEQDGRFCRHCGILEINNVGKGDRCQKAKRTSYQRYGKHAWVFPPTNGPMRNGVTCNTCTTQAGCRAMKECAKRARIAKASPPNQGTGGIPPTDARNPKDIAGSSKPQLHLIPAGPLVKIAAAMSEGAGKYGAYNWREKKIAVTAYISAALRHLLAYQDGEDIDPLSGLHHIDKTIAGLFVLRDGMLTGNATDDRPTTGARVGVAGLLINPPEVRPDMKGER